MGFVIKDWSSFSISIFFGTNSSGSFSVVSRFRFLFSYSIMENLKTPTDGGDKT